MSGASHSKAGAISGDSLMCFRRRHDPLHGPPNEWFLFLLSVYPDGVGAICFDLGCSTWVWPMSRGVQGG